MRRARSGPGGVSQWDTRTAYFWKQSSWGGPIAGSCYTIRVFHSGGKSAGNGAHKHKHGGGGGGGGGLPVATPAPAPTGTVAP
jgi:hypothetical protein